MAKIQVIGTSSYVNNNNKKTSQSTKKSSIKYSSMNKSKKRSTKPYKGQG